jgi:serine/threonine-protein kinase
MAQHARQASAAPLTAPSWSVMAEVTQILCPFCHKSNQRRARFCQHCGGDMVLNNHAPSDELRYVITRVVKQGGQGAVYEGIDESGKIYAIKEMLDSKFADNKERSEAITRFNEEAELLQGLSHPRIPRIYSHFTDEGRHYLTMDFIRGEDLEQVAEREGRVAEARVLEWADQICDVLMYLHGRNLVYRDMKPSNVMIERATGSVKLVDFGIAKLFKPTERGTQIGTPGYAPPEQYQGLATPQSDIYALGATLHHLLTGRDPTEEMPFSFPPARSLNLGVSEGVSQALERALQKVPQDRFDTIRDFWEALRPERARQPGQVRVAAATQRIPQAAAAQVSAAPAMAGSAPAPARPAPAAPRSAPARPAAPPAPPAPVRPAPPRTSGRPARRGFFGTVRLIIRWMLTLAVVALVALGGYVYMARPAWAEPYVGPLLELVPTAAPTSAPALSAQLVRYELEVAVPSGADAATIRQAFLDAFAERAVAELGASTLVFQNRPPSYIGSPELIADAGGQASYRATMEGSVYRP